jgi:2-methylcitrate dehydratase PrpD
MIQAQFSVPTVIALAITGVEPGPKWYITGRFKDPDILELAKKVKFENDPEAVDLELKQGKMMSTVKIVFKDGTVKQATCKNIKGSPGNPMSEKELEAKFKANAAGIMSDTQINRIIGTVMELEKLPRIGDLLKMLVSTKNL